MLIVSLIYLNICPKQSDIVLCGHVKEFPPHVGSFHVGGDSRPASGLVDQLRDREESGVHIDVLMTRGLNHGNVEVLKLLKKK